MDKLLEKSRMINRLLQRTGGRPVDFLPRWQQY